MLEDTNTRSNAILGGGANIKNTPIIIFLEELHANTNSTAHGRADGNGWNKGSGW